MGKLAVKAELNAKEHYTSSGIHHGPRGVGGGMEINVAGPIKMTCVWHAGLFHVRMHACMYVCIHG